MATLEIVVATLVFAWVVYVVHEEIRRPDREELKNKADGFDRLAADLEKDDSDLIDFLYSEILFRVGLVFSKNQPSDFDLFSFCRRLPCWIDECASENVGTGRSGVVEDKIAIKIASVCRVASSFPWRVLRRRPEHLASIIDHQISLDCSDTQYLSKACSNFLLDKISHDSSYDAVKFFKAIKKKWPDFTWTRANEAGFIE